MESKVESNVESSIEYGKCCICKGECSESSQTCSICARDLTGYSLGWNESSVISDYLSGWVPPVKEESSTANIVTSSTMNIARRRNTKKIVVDE